MSIMLRVQLRLTKILGQAQTVWGSNSEESTTPASNIIPDGAQMLGGKILCPLLTAVPPDQLRLLTNIKKTKYLEPSWEFPVELHPVKGKVNELIL